MPPHVAEAVTPTGAILATGSAGQTSTADVNGLRLVAEWHEVKPQRTVHQYVTGLSG
jgi:hypothetical protein